MKFRLKEDSSKFVFCNEVLEYGIVIGLNISRHDYTQDFYPDLNLPLKDDWNINGSILKVSEEEASLYAVHGMSAINSSIRTRNVKELYVLRIYISRKPNLENVLIWLPPVFMLILLSVSFLLVYKRDLTNSLRVYLTVTFFSFGHLSTLREITPPTITSIENLTLVDAFLCLLLCVIAILMSFKKEKEGGNRDNKKNKEMNALKKRRKWLTKKAVWNCLLVSGGILMIATIFEIAQDVITSNLPIVEKSLYILSMFFVLAGLLLLYGLLSPELMEVVFRMLGLKEKNENNQDKS